MVRLRWKRCAIEHRANQGEARFVSVRSRQHRGACTPEGGDGSSRAAPNDALHGRYDDTEVTVNSVALHDMSSLWCSARRALPSWFRLHRVVHGTP